MKRSAKILCAALALLMLTAVGCSDADIAPQQSEAVHTPDAQEKPSIGTESIQTASIPLYFLSTQQEKLVSQMRDVTAQNNITLLEAALWELIAGPLGDNSLRVFPTGSEILSVEVSKNVVNVDLNDRYRMMDKRQQAYARAAVACTVYEITEIENVNLFCEGMEVGYEDKPIGHINYRKYADDLNGLILFLEDTYQTYYETQKEKAVEHNVALYFADKRGQYLLPETRTFSVSTARPATEIIQELIAGPNDIANLSGVMPQGTELLEEPQITIDSYGMTTVELNFSKMPELIGSTNDLSRSSALYYASIVYTLSGYIPNVDAVIFRQNGLLVTSIEGLGSYSHGRMQRGDFSDYIGSQMTLYFSSQTQEAFVPVSRSVGQQALKEPIECIYELLRGPQQTEGGDEAFTVFPAGIVKEDIRKVVLQNDSAFIDVSGHFAAVCGSMEQRAEWILIYAIVNTITETQRVKSVQFLVDGHIVQNFGVYAQTISREHVSLHGPLMRNSGFSAVNG
ncbi:MAG: GerMN domain-containing protein [Christensenellales bacterium]|jgi:spore germination protein GerM